MNEQQKEIFRAAVQIRSGLELVPGRDPQDYAKWCVQVAGAIYVETKKMVK